MIGYVTLGTNDLPRAAAFYDTLMAEIGAKRVWEVERGIAWGQSEDSPSLCLMRPFDGKPATVGNGVMVSLAADSRATVDRVYQKAMSLGGKDEGGPGARSETFYAAFFRDLEGNKLGCFFAG
jgi:catechol 2,3-dioxygenase-like lactoylglutathione lyase family enzyme